MRLRNIPGAREVIGESSFTINEPASLRGKWKNAFGNDRPIRIEIGMGKGRYLMDMAAAHPEINWIGIEMYSSVLLRAVQKMERMENVPENVRLIRMDAQEIETVFAEGEVDRIYLNFSDPWPKARHAHRRLTSGRFLARYERVLAKGGQIEFKTDNQELFAFSLEEIAGKGWHLAAKTRDLHSDPLLSDGNIMTEYEERYASMGHPIC